jgi:hypothetical protein
MHNDLNPATEQRRLERAEKDRKANLSDRQEAIDWRDILELPGGRRVLIKILKACKYDQDPSHPSSSEMYKIVGRQLVAHEILNEIYKISEGLHNLLLKEYKLVVKSKQVKGGTDGERD